VKIWVRGEDWSRFCEQLAREGVEKAPATRAHVADLAGLRVCELGPGALPARGDLLYGPDGLLHRVEAFACPADKILSGLLEQRLA